MILIGQALGLGRRYEGSRLILSVLFKALVFGVFIAVFGLLEHLIEGLLRRETWDQIAHRLLSAGRGEILARTVMITVTLVPIFAFWETIESWATTSCSGCFSTRQPHEYWGVTESNRRTFTPVF